MKMKDKKTSRNKYRQDGHITLSLPQSIYFALNEKRKVLPFNKKELGEKILSDKVNSDYERLIKLSSEPTKRLAIPLSKRHAQLTKGNLKPLFMAYMIQAIMELCGQEALLIGKVTPAEELVKRLQTLSLIWDSVPAQNQHGVWRKFLSPYIGHDCEIQSPEAKEALGVVLSALNSLPDLHPEIRVNFRSYASLGPKSNLG